MAASTASVASAARAGGFNPVAALPWAVPSLLMIPIVGFVLLLAGVRTRRSASTLVLVTILLTLAVTVFVAVVRHQKSAPYLSGYPWIVSPVALSGATQFQNFTVTMAIGVDHAVLAFIAAGLLVLAFALWWHRGQGRSEQGPIRFQVAAALLLAAAVGVFVSTDLVEIFAFWSLAGVATYLLLAHRWGTDAAAASSRVALSLPLLGDLSLLAGIAVIYSRYGTLSLGQLDGVLHSTAGAGLKSLTTAAILIGLAVVVRAAVWPFHAWQTGTLGAPPAAIVMVVGMWPLLAGSVLIRALPIINGAGPQARTAIAVALVVGVLGSTLYALVSEGARMALVLAGTGAVGLTLLAILGGKGVSASMAALLAVGIGRGAAQLALSSITSGLRSDRLQELGGAWTRLPRASAALLLSVAAMMAATAAALASRPLPWPNWLAAIGLGLTAISLGSLYALVGHGLLRRRRTFDPARVREPAGLVWVATLIPAALALLAAALVHWTGWTRFVTQDQSPPNIPRELAWVALAAVIAVIGGFILSRPPRRLCIELWRLGALVARAWAGAVGLLRRFGAEPVMALSRAFETQALGRAGSEIGSALRAVGELGLPLPEPPLKQNPRSRSGPKPRS